MHPQRIKEQEEVRKVVGYYLNEYRRQFPELLQADTGVWDLLEEKSQTPGIRSFIAYKLYTSSGGERWREIIGPLLGMIEMSIVSTYATNKIFDQKSGGKTLTDINKKIISSAIAREGMYHILHKYFAKELIEKNILWFEFSEIHRWFYLGQYINSFKTKIPVTFKERLFIERLPEGFKCVEDIIKKVKYTIKTHITGLTDEELDNFLYNQFLRLYLINSHFYERIAVISVKIHKEDLSKDDIYWLSGFGALYGVGSQIINDIIDFTLPSMGLECMAKTTYDYFNDLKNRLLTFPVFLGLFSKSNSTIKDLLKDYYWNHRDIHISYDIMEEILLYLLDTKSIQLSLKIAAICLEEAFNCILNSKVIDVDSSLRDIFGIYKDSRFIVNIFKWYKRTLKEKGA